MRARSYLVASLAVLAGLGVGLWVHGLAADPVVVGPPANGLPDLVIKQVTVIRTGEGGELPAYALKVVVKNTGSGGAAATTTGVLGTDDINGGPTGAGPFGAAATPPIPARGSTTVNFVRRLPLTQAYWIFVADAPVVGKPVGRLAESAGSTQGKCNNSFVVAYSSALGNPQTFTNTWVP